MQLGKGREAASRAVVYGTSDGMRLWPTKYEIRLGPNDQSGLGAYLGDLSTYLNDGSPAANVNQTAAVEFCPGQ